MTDRCDIETRLARWSANALQLIVKYPVLWSFRSQLIALSEYALVASVTRLWRPAASEWARIVVQLLSEANNQERMAHALDSIPSSASALAWIVEAQTSFALSPFISIDYLLDALLKRATVPVTNGYPYGGMEALYMHYRLVTATGVSGNTNGSQPEFSFNWEEGHLLSFREIYELVHAVFYLTDFGRHGWKAGYEILPSYRSQIGAALSRAAMICMNEGHFDLIGEIVFAARCLGHTEDVGTLEGVLLNAQLVEGAIPAWRGARGIRYLYHSSLVGLLALWSARRYSLPLHRQAQMASEARGSLSGIHTPRM